MQEALRAQGFTSIGQVFPSMNVERSFTPGPKLDIFGRGAGPGADGLQAAPATPFRTLAILTQFPGKAGTVAPTFFDNLLFSTGSTQTVRSFYLEGSYGVLDVVTVNLPSTIGWQTAPNPYAYYVNGNYCTGTYPNNCQRLAWDMVQIVDPLVNFANYDNDGDGYVDSIFIIHAGQGAEFTGSVNDVWSHSWVIPGQPMTGDGVRVSNYTTEPEYWISAGDMTHGVYVHELGHAFGLPDFYDIAGPPNSEGVGSWSLMAGGSWNGVLGNRPAHMDAYSREYLEFNVPIDITGTVGDYVANNVQANQANAIYRINSGQTGEYWLIENRQQTGSDIALPGNGLLIWHVDDNMVGSNQDECFDHNNYNCPTLHFRLALEQADGALDLENNSNGGDQGDPYPGSSNNNEWSSHPGIQPNSTSYFTSSSTGIELYVLSPSGAAMTFHLGPPNGLSINSIASNEGDAGTTSFNFVVTLNPASGSTVTVRADTQNISAVAPGDYTAVTAQTVTFVPGDTSETVTVQVNGDTSSEPDEAFRVVLSNPVGATIGDGQGLGTIVNDDGVPDCTLPIPDYASLVYCINWANSTSPGDDTLTLGANIPITGTLPDIASPITLQGAGYSLSGGDAQPGFNVLGGATFTLNNITLRDFLVTARDGGAVYNAGTLTITNSTLQDNVASGTNRGGALYTLGPTTISGTTFSGNTAPNGGAIRAFNTTVNITGSTFIVNSATGAGTGGGAIILGTSALVNASGVSFIGNSAVFGGAIMNTSGTLTVERSTFSGNSASANGGALYNNTTRTSSVMYSTFNDNTATSGGTALANSGTGVINLGGVLLDDTGASNCIGTAVTSLGYNFSDDASCPFGAGNNAVLQLGPLSSGGPGLRFYTPAETSPAVGTIPNGTALAVGPLTLRCNGTQTDQPGNVRPLFAGIACTSGAVEVTALPTLSINDVALSEGNSGTTNAVFTLTLSETSGTNVTVQVNTADGTAAAGSDYTALVGQLATITAGNLTTTVSVAVSGDTTVELDEVFLVNLSSASGAVLTDAQGVGTITNDDAATLTIDDISQDEGSSGITNFVFTVSLTNAVDTAFSINYNTADGTATIADNDYIGMIGGTLNFAGTAGETQVITIQGQGDTTIEPDETFLVNLSNLQASGRAVSFADTQGQGTILNDDYPDCTLPIPDYDTLVYCIDWTNTISPGADTLTLGANIPITGTLPDINSPITLQGAGYTLSGGDAQPGFNVLGGATFTLNNITLRDFLVSLRDGGAVYNAGTLTITNSTLQDNVAAGARRGGALYTLGPTTISGTTFSGNTAPNGGAIRVFSTTVNITGSTFILNSATGAGTGGGAIILGLDAVVNASGVSFISNSAVFGGAINNTSGTLTVERSTFSGNSASATGGALSNSTGRTSSVMYSTFDDNTATSGGTALANSGTGVINLGGVLLDDAGAGNCTGTAVTSLGYNFSDDASCSFGAGDSAVLQLGPLSSGGPGLRFYTPAVTSPAVGAIPNGTALAVGPLTLRCNDTQTDQPGSARPIIPGEPCTGGSVEVSPLPNLTINDVTLSEGSSGATNAVFTLTLSKSSGSNVTVQVDTADGTATAGSDYTALTGQIATITAGSLTTTVSVSVNGDTTVELDEVFLVNLGSASGATLADVQGVGTITNDDAATLSIDDVAQYEGSSGITNFVFTVSLTNAVDSALSLTFDTADGTAVAPGDYTGVTGGTLNFAGTAGETQAITIQIQGDMAVEPDETFLVDLSNLLANGRAVSLADAQGQGTILNDDLPTLSIDDVAVTEGSSGTINATFTLTLSQTVGSNVTVQVDTADGTAAAGSDYSALVAQIATITAGNLTTTVDVAVNGDTTFEADETFTVNLSSASGATIADAQGLGTISNDDTAPTLSINDVTLSEGSSGSANATFTVSLSTISGVDASFQVDTADGTATTADNDYGAVTGLVLTITAGNLSTTVDVAVNGDTTFEADETFTVNLSNASGATITDPQGTGTITNDDLSAPMIEFNPASIITPGCTPYATRIPLYLYNFSMVPPGYTLETYVFNAASEYYMILSITQVPNQPDSNISLTLAPEIHLGGYTVHPFPVTELVTIRMEIWDGTHTLLYRTFTMNDYDCTTGGYSSYSVVP